MKKHITKETVTAFIVIAIILITGAVTLITNFGALRSSVADAGSLEDAIAGIDAVYDENLFMHDAYIELFSALQSGADIIDDAEYGYIIRDAQGKLHFPMPANDPQSCAKNAVNFMYELVELGTPMLYVQAPSKKLAGYTVFPTGAENVANEDADEFLSLVRPAGLDVIDLRELIISQDLDRDALFYRTDHHWTTTAAFWAYDTVAGWLDGSLGLGLDPTGEKRDIGSFKVTQYPESFLGSQGRRVGRSVAGVDDYAFIEPDFATDYHIYNMNESETEPMASGPFSQSIVLKDVLNDPDIETNRHGAYFFYDYGHLRIVNRLAGNDRKVLLIKDSFALPFAAYLSTCVGELHIMDLRDAGNLYTPLELCRREGFDAVVILYNPEVFFSPMFDFR